MTRRPRQMLLCASLLAAALHVQPALAQQGWAPTVVSALPGATDQAAGARAAPPAAAPQPVTPTRRRPALSAAPALMQVAVEAPKPPAAAAPPAPVVPAATPARRGEAPPFATTAARQFCVNIADAAAEAKFAWQKRALADLQQELDQRIALLDAKAAELQKWVARRDEFANKARENLVLIYARMRPDAAAMQLSAMDEETAAAVLVKLDARISSAILNEMQPAQAARLTATIAGAARTAPKGSEDRKS